VINLKILIGLVALSLLFGIAVSGTVSLTGTCYPQPVSAPSGNATFNLLNTGNESATSILIVPNFNGGSAVNRSVSLSSLSPGQNVTFTFQFDNLSTPGSYAGSYSAAYSQGSQTFFALFPCIINFGKVTSSLVRITSVYVKGNAANVSLVNLASAPIIVNVSMMMPEGFSFSPLSRLVYLGPHASNNTMFAVSQPTVSGVSYSAGTSASYTSGGLHYATLLTYTLNFYKAPGLASSPYTVYAIAALIIIVLAGLILLSILRKKKSGASKRGAEGKPK
jgi:hypothetical protein